MGCSSSAPAKQPEPQMKKEEKEVEIDVEEIVYVEDEKCVCDLFGCKFDYTCGIKKCCDMEKKCCTKAGDGCCVCCAASFTAMKKSKARLIKAEKLCCACCSDAEKKIYHEAVKEYDSCCECCAPEGKDNQKCCSNCFDNKIEIKEKKVPAKKPSSNVAKKPVPAKRAAAASKQ